MQKGNSYKDQKHRKHNNYKPQNRDRFDPNIKKYNFKCELKRTGRQVLVERVGN